jgi:hypothetical protein
MTTKAALLQGTVAMVALTGAFVYSLGAVRVEVREKQPNGDHIHLILPAAVLPIGAAIAPREKIEEAARQVQPWLPTIRAASEELQRCPDTTFIEVENPREHVTIRKIGNALVIDVDSERETVHVSVPLKALEYTVGQLASKAPPA